MTSLNIAISYSNRSSITGRAILEALNGHARVRRAWRKTDTANPTRRADVFVAWGDRREYAAPNAHTWINTASACQNASRKDLMLSILASAEIPIPSHSVDLDDVDSLRNRNGFFYVRDRFGGTRFSNAIDIRHDLYVTKPVPFKRREYRIHVFDGTIFAMYEKVPHDIDERPPLFKVDNCKFNKLDPTRSKCGLDGQQIAIKAVNALGLTYGAVDLIRDKNQRYTVCEVNSSAGLNTLNVQRLVDLIVAKAERNSRI